MLTFLRNHWNEAWYPWTEGGLPTTGYTLGRLLYWPQLFFALVSPLEGTLAYFLLHQLVAYSGAFLYLRHRQMRGLPALLGALAYAGSAARVHYAINFVFYPILTLAPLLLYLLEKTALKPGPAPALGVSLTLATIFSGGGWQLTAIFGVNFALYGLVWILTSRRRRALLPRAALWLALAASLAFIYCLPVNGALRELYQLGVIRSVPFAPEVAGGHGLLHQLGWQSLYPPFAGSLEQLNSQRGFNTHEFVASPGIALLPLALLGLWPRRGRRLWSLTWLGLLALDAGLALGSDNPLYRALQDHVPMLTNLRQPIRFLVPFPILLMGLVAAGVERLQGSPRSLAVLPLAYYGLYCWQGRPEWWVANLLLLASALAALVYCTAPGRARLGALLVAAGCQVAAPVLFVEGQFFTDTQVVRQEMALLQDLKRQLPGPLTSIYYAINPESPALVGVRSVAGFSPFMLLRYAHFLFAALHGREMTPAEFQSLLWQNFHPLSMLEGEPRPRWDHPMARMLCAAFLVLPERVERLPLAYPGYWLSRDFAVVGDPVRARTRMCTPGFDPLTTALLDDTPGSAVAYREGKVRLVAYRPSHMVFRVEDASGWLTVASAAYPGWTALVDGREVPVYLGYTIYATVAVPPGTHQVELVFRPQVFYAGLPWLGVCLVGWLALLVAAAKQARRG